MLDKLAKHHDYWIKILINLGCNLDLAKDIVQEMYIKLHDASNIAYGEDDVNKYYVYKTLKTLYIQYLKDSIKESSEFDGKYDYTEEDYPIERDLAEDIILAKVRDIASKWNNYDRELFQVYFGVRLDKDNINIKEGKSMRDISQGTDISVGSIFYSIKEFKKQFRDSLREDMQDYYNEDFNRIK